MLLLKIRNPLSLEFETQKGECFYEYSEITDYWFLLH